MGIVRPPPEGNLTAMTAAPIVVEPDMTPADPVEQTVATLRSERNRIDHRIRAHIKAATTRRKS